MSVSFYYDGWSQKMDMKSCLIVEKGVIEETGFPLETRLTIGRAKENDVYLADRRVSRRHAVIYWSGGHAFVEDLGSRNGTFLNGERVDKSVISSGDIIRIGTVVLHFVENGPSSQGIHLVDTEEIPRRAPSFGFHEEDRLFRSGGLEEVISRVPLLFDLGEKERAAIHDAAQLVVVDRGKSIVRQGDRGKFLYIVLDGKVRAFVYDNRGREVPVSHLMENDFFGEMPFFTGAPWATTVQAVEETVLCTLSFEAVREILERSPSAQGLLERHHRQSARGLQDRKWIARIVERRRHPRVNDRLPVTFLFPPSSSVYHDFKGTFFVTISSDLSLSGIRVKIQDRPLLGLPIGCEVRMRIKLMGAQDFLQCLGRLRSVVRGKTEDDLGYLGIEFPEMPQDHRQRLERFLLN